MLHPKKEIHKFLISSPSKIVGEYSTDGLLISHAWPDLMSPSGPKAMLHNSPIFRTYLVAVVEIKNEKEKTIVVPNYHPFGDFLSICMSVLFGKRFDHHGFLETQGHFCFPTKTQPDPIGMSNIGPFNHDPRKDLPIDLNIKNFNLIAPLLTRDNDKALNIFRAAGSFYLHALQIIEEQSEIAFVDLVTAGEILSNFYDFPDEELLDNNIKKLIEEIAECHPNPDQAIGLIRSRLYQVRRKYSLTLTSSLNDNFFSHFENSEKFSSLTKDKIERRIKASYDLRSRYVHTGLKFGNWITALSHGNDEVIIGKPVVEDNEYKKLLMLTPTFLGLERIIRYSLLTFVHKNMCKISEKLN